jgi:hypothetical protein
VPTSVSRTVCEHPSQGVRIRYVPFGERLLCGSHSGAATPRHSVLILLRVHTESEDNRGRSAEGSETERDRERQREVLLTIKK